MKAQTFTFNSTDGEKIFVYKWLPDSQPWMILNIVHGMAEHAARYEDFARFLTDNGIGVYAMDLRGHGKTAGTMDKFGFFAPKDGWKKVLEDIHSLVKIISHEWKGLPIVMLGHSMGSLFTRAYIAKYPDTLDGAILSGTSGQSGFLVSAGKTIAKLQGIFAGKTKPSKLLNNMTFQDYNKAFRPNKTEFDWLSRDSQQVKKYIDDPWCGGVVSNSFYYDLLSLVQFINRPETYLSTPKEMPILMFSGEKDPVGDFGKGVKKVYDKYLKSGIKNITLKLYPDGRHEMLNEINRKEVYEDVLDWLKTNFQKQN